ncbi:PadR family transcriptional regulator [Stenotrophomonas maltophilia]|nr:PadR family transcriptional regulator [Stenotrophomonas maltophilia]MBN5135102.1 PadR family transcriptional regulator [Stenotrophomonas maltophilia]
MSDPVTERKEKLVLELRRGVLVLSVLLALREERYAYVLRKELVASGIDIEEGTLYPLLRRIEDQGLLESDWRDADGRRRRYYRLSREGRNVLEDLKDEWTHLAAAVNALKVD